MDIAIAYINTKGLDQNSVAGEVAMMPDNFFAAWLSSLKVLDMRERLDACGELIDLPKLAKVLGSLPNYSNLHVLHVEIPTCTGGLIGTSHVLDSLLHLVQSPAASKLRVLGLHGISLRDNEVRTLVQVLTAMKGQLQGLYLSFRQLEQTPNENSLFGVISEMPCLRALALPQWGHMWTSRQSSLLLISRSPDLTVLIDRNIDCEVLRQSMLCITNVKFARCAGVRFSLQGM